MSRWSTAPGRNAGVKFYRLILIVSGALVVCAAAAHALANAREAALAGLVLGCHAKHEG